MNLEKAIKILTLEGKTWNIGKWEGLLDILGILEKRRSHNTKIESDFEFSAIENEKKIRFLHLVFWDQNLPPASAQPIFQWRESAIFKIFKQVQKQYHASFCQKAFLSLMRFNRENGPWPIQIGVEYRNTASIIIKLYLSLSEPMQTKTKHFFWHDFCSRFKLKFPVLSPLFQHKQFDAVAIDFLPNKKIVYKFYPLFAPNAGYLLRLSSSTILPPSKVWQRFPEGAPLKKISFFQSTSTFDLISLLKKNRFKISYLCEDESGRRGFYFR